MRAIRSLHLAELEQIETGRPKGRPVCFGGLIVLSERMTAPGEIAGRDESKFGWYEELGKLSKRRKIGAESES